MIGAHAKGFNTGSVGVAVLGTYGDVAPTAAAQKALTELLAPFDLGELFECYVDCGLDENVVVAGSPRDRVPVGQGDRVTVTFPPEACVVVRG